MKTVDVVMMGKGYYVTRRLSGMNKGAKFFPTVAPEDMKKREAKKFLAESMQAKDNFINEWVGE